MKKVVKVLQVAHGMETFGGVESYLLQYYRQMDTQKVQWDFVFCCNNTLERYKDDPALSGARISALHCLKPAGNSLRNYIDLVRALNQYMGNNEYDVIHINTSNVFLQFVCAVGLKTPKIRVAHSHSAKAIMANPKVKDRMRLGLKGLIEPLLKIFIRNKNDYLFACSEEAGSALFGKPGLKSKKFRVIKNAIVTDKYLYNKNTRKIIRDKYNISSGTTVYGTVGRLAESKNLLFLVDVFYELHKTDDNAVLWIVGEGPMRQQLEEKIRRCNVERSVKLLGEQKDVSAFLQAMDCFIFTTVYEGLGIVAVEAQAADLVTIVSDAVPKEAAITERFKHIELNKSSSQWAKEIRSIMNEKSERRNTKAALVQKGYDISDAASTLCRLYQDMVLRGKTHVR